jgi:hypothetical protein
MGKRTAKDQEQEQETERGAEAKTRVGRHANEQNKKPRATTGCGDCLLTDVVEQAADSWLE